MAAFNDNKGRYYHRFFVVWMTSHSQQLSMSSPIDPIHLGRFYTALVSSYHPTYP